MKKLNPRLVIVTALILAPFSFGVFFAFGQADDTTTNPEVQDLNRQIRQKKEQADALQKKQQEYQQALDQAQSQKVDLNYQISILNNHVAKTQIELDSIKTEIDQTDLEIKKTNLEIMDKEDSIAKEKDHIASVIRLLYKKGQASSLEILLLNDSFSEFMNQVKYLGDVNGELSQSLQGLQDNKASLEKDKASQEIKIKQLADLKTQYDDKLAKLQTEKDVKNTILTQVSASEEQYQGLIAQAKREQAQAAADISNIEKIARNKITGNANQPQLTNPDGLIWPVPKNTITAYFHDPDYPFRYLFEHPAIDIRAPQSTKIHAAASGYVARAKDAGMGYSYIMLIHGDGLATVYGHVSRILVKEDDYVNQGDVIGLSGATPGTPGAGPLTSGPHLHFEVRLNGIPVNPLDYLN